MSGSISRTTISPSSSNARPVSLADGYGYGGGRAFNAAQTASFRILNTSTTILLWRFNVTVDAGYDVGLAGPGWNTTTDVTGDFNINNNGLVRLRSSNNQSEAGFFCGVFLKAHIFGSIQQGSVSWVGGWRGHFETSWQNLTSFDQNVSVDILQLIIKKIIEYLIKRNLKKAGAPKSEIAAVSVPRNRVPGGISLIARSTDRLRCQFEHAGDYQAFTRVPDAGTADFEPGYDLQLDVIQFIPGLRSLQALLNAIGSDLSAGIDLRLGLPLNVGVRALAVTNGNQLALYALRTPDASYDYQGDVNAIVETRNLAGNFNYGGGFPGQIGFQYVWAGGVSLTAGLFFNLNICHLGGFSASLSYNLLNLVGFPQPASYRTDYTTSPVGRVVGYEPLEILFEVPVPA